MKGHDRDEVRLGFGFADEHAGSRRPRSEASKPDSRALEQATRLFEGQEEGIAAWPSSVTAEWKSSRGPHLTREGRFWAGFFSVCAVLGFAAVLLIPSPYQDLPDAIACAVLLAAFGLALGAMRNWFEERVAYFDRESASFRLELSATSARLIKGLPDGSRHVQEIERADAAGFDVHFAGFGLGQRPALNRRIDYVRGWSRDGRSILVPNVIREERLQREGDRLLLATSPAEMLCLWWPFTPESATAQSLLLTGLPPDKV